MEQTPEKPAVPRKPMRLDAVKMDAELRPQSAGSPGLHRALMDDGMHRRLSDEEIIARGFGDDGITFDVPQEIIPDGMVYQWIAFEVFGQPNRQITMNAERNGWRAVPAARHPGVWTEPEFEGPIEIGGQRLYELPETEAYNRHRGLYLKAKMAKSDANRRLTMAPEGTGPRTHPGVRPQVSVSREALPIE